MCARVCVFSFCFAVAGQGQCSIEQRDNERGTVRAWAHARTLDTAGWNAHYFRSSRAGG